MDGWHANETRANESDTRNCIDFFNLDEVQRFHGGDQWSSRELHPHYYDRVQLYDLESDPREQVNLAEAMPDRVQGLRHILDGHLREFHAA